MPSKQFPMYLVAVDGKRKFYSIDEVAVIVDPSGWVEVNITGLVLNEDLTVRDITRDERWRIAYLANEAKKNK
jgi:hypothetical protein